MNPLLFVYGTLRHGQPLHRYLAEGRSRWVGEGTIPGRLFDLGEYPGATPDVKRFSRVRGEVHHLLDPTSTFTVLDDIEGYDPKRPERSHFERRTATVQLEDGSAVEAWVYYYRRPLGRALEIPDGDFVRFRAEQ